MRTLLLITLLGVMLLGCNGQKHPIIEEMDDAYHASSTNHRDVTEAVKKYLDSKGEVDIVGYLAGAGFKVIRYNADGLTNLNDGYFKPYRDKSFKKSAFSNLQGSYRYLATINYNHRLVIHKEARIIFDVKDDHVVNLRGYVFVHGI